MEDRQLTIFEFAEHLKDVRGRVRAENQDPGWLGFVGVVVTMKGVRDGMFDVFAFDAMFER